MELEYRFGLYGAIGYGGYFCDSRFVSDFPLVGSKLRATNALCGVFSRVKGCKNHLGHVGKVLPEGVFGSVGLDGLIGEGMAVTFPRAQHCSDPLCPVCCFDFARRTARRAMGKFDAFDGVFGMISDHIAVSVPKHDWSKPFDFLRKQASSCLEMVGVKGGMLMYHPKRWHRQRKIWYFSPHFHCLGYLDGGRFDGLMVREVYVRTEYVVRVFDKRKSILGTLLYQLSHAGIPAGHVHAVSWFGCCGSRASRESGVSELIRANEVEDRRKRSVCPVCGERLKCLCRVANSPRFEYERYEEKFVLDGVDNWCVVDLPFRRGRKVVDDGGGDDYEAFAAGFG